MSYASTFKTVKNQDFIIFEADEQVAIILMEQDTAITTRYNVDEFDMKGTYRKCVLTCDTCIKCKRLQHIGGSDQLDKSIRIFTTELIISDIDNDGHLEFYWFAVNNGELIKYEVFSIKEGQLKRFDKDIKSQIINTPRFEELKKISLLNEKPKL
jgi:hypothetical protein